MNGWRLPGGWKGESKGQKSPRELYKLQLGGVQKGD